MQARKALHILLICAQARIEELEAIVASSNTPRAMQEAGVRVRSASRFAPPVLAGGAQAHQRLFFSFSTLDSRRGRRYSSVTSPQVTWDDAHENLHMLHSKGRKVSLEALTEEYRRESDGKNDFEYHPHYLLRSLKALHIEFIPASK